MAFAHEAGHAYGLADEEKAECFGVRHVGRAAFELRYTRAQLPAIVRQARGETYCGKGL